MLLPQASVAVQVRAMTLAFPQGVVTASLKRMVTALHESCAVATPVALVLVTAGHSSTRSCGQVMVGLVVSRTVMVCTQAMLLPHWSVAVQVRVSTRVAPQFVLTASL